MAFNSPQDNLQGYKTQNKFLNKEILELSALRRNAERRERDLMAKVGRGAALCPSGWDMEASRSRHALNQSRSTLGCKVTDRDIQRAECCILRGALACPHLHASRGLHETIHAGSQAPQMMGVWIVIFSAESCGLVSCL